MPLSTTTPPPQVSPLQDTFEEDPFKGFSRPPSTRHGRVISIDAISTPSPTSSSFSRKPSSGIINGSRPQSMVVAGTQRPASVVFASRPQSMVFNRDANPLGRLAAKRDSSGQSSPVAPGRIIVGIDFGTTYSGVAIVHSAMPDEIEIIKSWPGAHGVTSDKVPTELSYAPAPTPLQRRGSSHLGSRSSKQLLNASADPGKSSSESNDQTNGNTTLPRWGFQLTPSEPRLRCLKLFLDRAQTLPTYISPIETAAHLRSHDKTVLDALTDYLSLLHNHTIDHLVRRYGPAFTSYTPLEYVLTLPAIWSDAAKHATLLAASRAGMGPTNTIKLISEPEAAALYTLKTFLPSFVSTHEHLIVCDAGGGTVDIIAYRIMQRAPVRIEESAVGTGGLVGSGMLNFRFEELVKQRLGKERFRELREEKPRTWAMAARYFEETVKRTFCEGEDMEFSVPVPGLADDEEAGIEDGFMILVAEEVEAVFAPIVAEVVALVEGQVREIQSKGEVVSAIILVGGFGQSNYLYTRLKTYFGKPEVEDVGAVEGGEETPISKHRGIEVVQPLHAWTAVVRGACLRGLEGSIVVNRRARWHYGTSYATVFDPKKHPLSDRYWSPLWEKWMVSDRCQWHIAKGTRISERTAISFHYTRNFRWGQSLIVEDELMACDADTAPDAFDASLIPVCTLRTDLSAVPKELFTRLRTSNGVEFENLDFTLDMMIDSASIVFELKVDGVQYGQVTAEFH